MDTNRQQPTARIVTLGCKLNFAESATIARRLKEKGIDAGTAESADTRPDIIVVNTCSVTALADKKCRQQIRSLHRRYPDALIAVTGCYAQLKGQEVAAIDGVDIVLGNEEKLDLAEHVIAWLDRREKHLTVTRHQDIRRFSPSCECGDRTRYFLKVQDGCDYYCSYCTIPLARGRSRSGTIADLTRQAADVAAAGGKEIVITGVNIGDFGKNIGERFIDLVKALDAVDGIERYRISSLEPDLLDDELIDYCAASRAFMPHFHIPLQSGNDDVLTLMRRHYNRDLFARKVEKIRQAMPHAFIGVDVMAGTRGETEERFNDSYNFIAALDVQHLHVFPYSERPGTLALRIPYIVDRAEKERRVARLMALSERKERDFIGRFLGTARPVLIEQPPEGSTVMHGFTDNYIRLTMPYDPTVVNSVTDARLDTLGDNLNVAATIIQPS